MKQSVELSMEESAVSDEWAERDGTSSIFENCK